MAKTKQEYETIGANLFKDGKPRPEGTSWQVKAQIAGYDAERNNKADKVLNAIFNNPRQKHVENLYSIADKLKFEDIDMKRYFRIMRKVQDMHAREAKEFQRARRA